MTSRSEYVRIGDDSNELCTPGRRVTTFRGETVEVMPQYGDREIPVENLEFENGNYDYPVFTGIEELQKERLAQNIGQQLVQRHQANFETSTPAKFQEKPTPKQS
jgi:hypothetical protein